MDETLQRWFERYAPDTKKNWMERLLLRNTGGEKYSLVNNTIFLPKAEARELTCYCPTCTKPLRGTNPQVYFGDWICGGCFEQFTGKFRR